MRISTRARNFKLEFGFQFSLGVNNFFWDFNFFSILAPTSLFLGLDIPRGFFRVFLFISLFIFTSLLLPQ